MGKLLSGTFESIYSLLLFMKLEVYHYFPSVNMASNVKATKRLLTYIPYKQSYTAFF